MMSIITNGNSEIEIIVLTLCGLYRFHFQPPPGLPLLILEKNGKSSTFSNFISLIEVEVTPLCLIVSSFFLGLMTIEISISINQLLL